MLLPINTPQLAPLIRSGSASGSGTGMAPRGAMEQPQQPQGNNNQPPPVAAAAAAAGSAGSAEDMPSPQSVGREFVRQYYTLLNRSPLHLHR